MAVNKSRLDEKTKEENRIASGWLLWYKERKKELEEKQQEIIHSANYAFDKPVTSREMTASDLTANKAIRLSKLEKESNWVHLVERIEKGLALGDRVFLQLRRKYRYRRGPCGWTAVVQCEYPKEMEKRTGQPAKDFYIEHRNTFIAWWNRIVDFTVREAIRKKLI